jgi:hypothetical protein
VTRPSAALHREVIRRAGKRCEYCLVHQDDVVARHQVDHVISVKHGGTTELSNLALSCLPCNRRKSSDIGAFDKQTGQFVRLFDPRGQSWADHFQVRTAQIIGLTAEGRATVVFLQLNSPQRLQERADLIRLGRYPQLG